MKSYRGIVVCVLGACWALAVAAGFAALWRYKATPGEQTAGRSQWPHDSGLAPVAGCRNLVVALHPHCPCSRATVAELEKLLACQPADLHVHILLYRPKSADESWLESDLVREVKKIPGVSIVPDDDGALATRFGALTSGHVILYGLQDELLFQGGITASRGHQGDAPAQQVLRAQLRGESSESYKAPVYGCPLSGRDDPEPQP